MKSVQNHIESLETRSLLASIADLDAAIADADINCDAQCAEAADANTCNIDCTDIQGHKIKTVLQSILATHADLQAAVSKQNQLEQTNEEALALKLDTTRNEHNQSIQEQEKLTQQSNDLDAQNAELLRSAQEGNTANLQQAQAKLKEVHELKSINDNFEARLHETVSPANEELRALQDKISALNSDKNELQKKIEQKSATKTRLEQLVAEIHAPIV